MITLLRWEMGLFLGGLAAIVFYQMLTGRINLQGMLWEKNGATDYSWGRVQLLFFTIIFAFIYIGKVLQDPTRFPEIPQALLVLLGGSNLGYLGQKTYNLIFRGLPRP
jgi:hypothetical protein